MKDYMFNSKYIDYPVIGLSRMQAMKFCRWLFDRYNEHLLIKKSFYRINMNQVDEFCFVSESYLADQYMGFRGRRLRDSTLSWKDNVLLPNFRLPTENEAGVRKGLVKLEKQKGLKKFLKTFQDSLFLVKKDGLQILLMYPVVSKGFDSFIPRNDTVIDWGSIKLKEVFLSNEIKDYFNAYKDLNYKNRPMSYFKDEEGWSYEKDSIGLMNYLIIGRDVSGGMIQIEQDGFVGLMDDNSVNGILNAFRYAVTIKHLK